MSAVVLVWADRQIIARAAPHIAAILSGLEPGELASLIRQDKDMSDLLPAYEDQPGFGRNVVRARLQQAGDAFFDAMHATVCAMLDPTHRMHAVLLSEPEGKAWYRANVERLRDKILAQLGA